MKFTSVLFPVVTVVASVHNSRCKKMYLLAWPCYSVHMQQFRNSPTDFQEIQYFGTSQKLDNNKGHLSWRWTSLSAHISSFTF